MKKKAPCKGCTRRHAVCHDTCAEYRQWRGDMIAAKSRSDTYHGKHSFMVNSR